TGAKIGPPLLNVVGVKLTATGRTFACDPGALALRVGERVVLDDGNALAIVAVPPTLRPATPPLTRVLRLAYARDLARLAAAEVRAHLHQDGEESGPRPQPDEGVGPVRAPQVLPRLRRRELRRGGQALAAHGEACDDARRHRPRRRRRRPARAHPRVLRRSAAQ